MANPNFLISGLLSMDHFAMHNVHIIHTVQSAYPIVNADIFTSHSKIFNCIKTSISTRKDTWFFLVFIDYKKICEALTNGLWSYLLEVQSSSVKYCRIRNALLQFFAEFICSLNTTETT